MSVSSIFLLLVLGLFVALAIAAVAGAVVYVFIGIVTAVPIVVRRVRRTPARK